MRILLLNTFPVWGGDEKWTINVGVGLKAKGHQVTISCPPNGPTERHALENGLDVFPFHIGPDIAFWKIPPLKKYLKDNKIEVLLCVQNRDVKVGALAGRIAKVPAIFARQGLDTIKRRIDHKIPFTKFVDGIITNTRSIKQLYDSYGWFSNEFIHVVWDGLALPEEIKKIDLHEEFGLTVGSKVIVGTGRLANQKRFDLLIKVAEIAKQNKRNWSFVIVGTGDLENELKALAKKKGVDHIIKFIGFRDDVLSIMKSANLFVLSSDSEGMSNALREAMAVGLPCVATNVFGVEELFGHDNNGLSVKKGDYKSIYDAINKIFENSELEIRLRDNAAELIRTSFTINRMIDQIEALFLKQLDVKK